MINLLQGQAPLRAEPVPDCTEPVPECTEPVPDCVSLSQWLLGGGFVAFTLVDGKKSGKSLA